MYYKSNTLQSTKGSEGSLIYMIELHRLEVSRFLRSKVGCAETAADIFQSIAENLLRRHPDPPIEDVRAFLFRAARNAALNLLREKRTKENFNALAGPLLVEYDHLSPETVVESAESLEKIHKVFESLPVLTRKIFTLYRLHGVKQKDIAKQFGVSLSTVEKHVKKATDTCYSCLHD